MPDVTSPLSAWESFYVIVGSSGAALTGLMFVVITLMADSPERRRSPELSAFGTPTIVHFCIVLLVSAIVSAPWHTLRSVALALEAVGLGGALYAAIVIRRARRQTGYKPVLEDWVWYMTLPFLAYLIFLLSGVTLTRAPETALFGVATGALLLLFVGIHNAWDTVTYIAFDLLGQPNEAAKSNPVSAPPTRESSPPESVGTR